MKASMTQVSHYLYKKIFVEGNKEVPVGSRVSVHYNAYFEGATISFDSTYMRGKPTVFTLGNEEILYGLDQAVQTMKLHEEAQFIISWQWLYGEHGCLPRIQPKTDALFVIRLIGFKEIVIPLEPNEDGDITPFYKKMQEFARYNFAAKEAFNHGNITRAITNYKRGVHEIECCSLQNEDEEKVYNDSLKKSFLNLAVCYNKNQQPKQACSMLNNLKSIGGYAKNPKALYQEGKAQELLGSYERARNLLMQAKDMAGNDVMILNALKDIDEKLGKYRLEEKRIAKNALRGILNTNVMADVESNSNKNNTQKNQVTSFKYKQSIEEFIDSDLKTLTLPYHFSHEELQAIKSLEKQMGFKVSESGTMSEREIRLVKTEQK